MTRPAPFRSIFSSALIILTALAGCGGEQEAAAPPDAADVEVSDERRRVVDFWSHFREATRLRLNGEFEKARDLYELALKNNPDHEDALYYSGNVELTLGNWDAAKAKWSRLIDLNPNSSRAFSQLGNLALCNPETPVFSSADAREAFGRAHSLNPEETGPTLRLGQVALVDNEVEKAREYFDAVIGSDQTNTDALFLIAYIEWISGRGDKGLAELNHLFVEMQELPTAPVMGEGDTKTGKPLNMAESATCPLFQTFLDRMRGTPRPLDASVFVQFESLQHTLTAISS